MTENDTGHYIAVLIDGENFPPILAEKLFAEIKKIGIARERRVLGNLNCANMKGWLEIEHHHAVDIRHTVTGTPKKNAADIHLVIQAMDLLPAKTISAFALVTSDGDFLPLVRRIQREGKKVFGFGVEKTPKAFQDACDSFKALPFERSATKSAKVKKTPSPAAKSGPPLPDWLREAIIECTDESGDAPFAQLGEVVTKKNPASKKEKLSKLLKTYASHLEIIGAGKPGAKVRLRKK